MQTTEGSRVHMAAVIDRKEAAPGIVVLGLFAPELVAAARPGQFVMATPPCNGAAAVALGIYEACADRLALLFFVTGRRTRSLAMLAPGDTLELFGPLGNGFALEGQRDVAIVAGGVGIASMLLPAIELHRRGARVRLFYGARTAQRLVERERFAEAGCEIVAATEDGSEGCCGYVTSALRAAERPESILACGPTPMLRATAEIAAAWNVPAQLALEETFGCGVGACWGCVVPVAQDTRQAPSFPRRPDGVVYARICRDGPVFSADELRW